jgi:hypothetical protein
VEDTVNFMAVKNFRIVGERDSIKLTLPVNPFLICSPFAKKTEGKSKQAGKKRGECWAGL